MGHLAIIYTFLDSYGNQKLSNLNLDQSIDYYKFIYHYNMTMIYHFWNPLWLIPCEDIHADDVFSIHSPLTDFAVLYFTADLGI